MGRKAYNVAVVATADCLHYPQIHDVVRYGLDRMKKMLKDELDNKNTVQHELIYVFLLMLMLIGFLIALKAIYMLQIHDVVRYRLHRMKKMLKDELDNKNTVQQYICPKCGKECIGCKSAYFF